MVEVDAFVQEHSVLVDKKTVYDIYMIRKGMPLADYGRLVFSPWALEALSYFYVHMFPKLSPALTPQHAASEIAFQRGRCLHLGAKGSDVRMAVE